MRRSLLLLTLLAACSSAMASGASEYLKLRKTHGVTKPATAQGIESFLGERVIELAGTVKGTFRVGDSGSIMFQRVDGGTQVVDCDTIPEWLVGNETKARLLVRANRPFEGAELTAILVAAAPEADIAVYDKAATPVANSAAPAKKALASRKGSPRREWVLPASEVTPIYASFIKSRNKRLTDAEAMEIATGIVGFSLHYKVDARLIMAMVMVESGFNPQATSHAGAMGLGQLMPGTAAGLGVRNAYDKMENLYGTVKLVRGNLDKYQKQTNGHDYNSLVLALAAYNAGPGAVKKHGGVPPYRETQNYVRKVISLYYALSGQN